MRILNGAILFILLVALAAPLQAEYTITTLATFNQTNGMNPKGGLVADSSGNLFGTTTNGGANFLGTAFEFSASSHTLTTLVSFNNINNTNGIRPSGSLLIDASGNLYGTNSQAGVGNNGTVFKIAAGTHAVSLVAAFNGANGMVPSGDLIFDSSGNLLGTTGYGGSHSDGTVFEIAAGTNSITDLAAFSGSNGSNPNGPLLLDQNGDLFGTTYTGGTRSYGTVFEVAAGTHALSNLVIFNGTNGGNPTGGLITDSQGNFYGTTGGDSSNNGTVFEIAANTHALTTLVSFNGTNGKNPTGSLIADRSGNLFGVTANGGLYAKGTVFEISATSHTLTTIFSFNGTNGASPNGNLIFDANGNLYGTTFAGGPIDDGTVFKLSPVPEPEAMRLIALGSLVLLIFSVRGRVSRATFNRCP